MSDIPINSIASVGDYSKNSWKIPKVFSDAVNLGQTIQWPKLKE